MRLLHVHVDHGLSQSGCCYRLSVRFFVVNPREASDRIVVKTGQHVGKQGSCCCVNGSSIGHEPSPVIGLPYFKEA